MSVWYVIRQMLQFMRLYRKYWLAPVLFGVFAIGGLLVVAQSSPFAPFIYALF